jgi:hypothetical protein
MKVWLTDLLAMQVRAFNGCLSLYPAFLSMLDTLGLRLPPAAATATKRICRGWLYQEFVRRGRHSMAYEGVEFSFY